MSQLTFAILIDGLRHDYITPDDSPFLYKFRESRISGSLIEPLSFQTRPAFFAGLHPEESDVANLFWYDPQNSPFKFTKYFFCPERLYSLPKTRTFFQRGIGKITRIMEAKKGHTASAFYAYPAEIPYRFLHFFAFSERYNTWDAQSLPQPTLFDILRDYKKNWLWLGYPNINQRTKPLMEAFHTQLHPNYSFVYLHFAELDWVGHSHGPHSPECKRTLRILDEAVENVYNTLLKMFGEINGIIFGDHGMVKITKIINVEHLLRKTDLKVPRDYVYFLDSTQARFWFKNEYSQKIIREILEQLENGRILNEQDQKDLRIRYSHDKFGQLIFMVYDNTLIFPNFFQRYEPIKGMHGYLPDVSGNWAQFIVDAGIYAELEKPVHMIDLFPTFLDLLNLPIPSSHTFQSVLSQC